MEPWLIWLVAGLLLTGAEMVLPGAFLLWAGLAAAGTGLVMLALSLSFPVAVALFVVLLAASVAVGLRVRRAAGKAALNTPESGLVGRVGVVLPSTGPGLRVRVGDGDWAADGQGRALPPGTAVRVVGVQGTVLEVRAA